MTKSCNRVEDLRRQVAGWHAAGDKVALVPTMGALHAGHLALVDAARSAAERVVVTIFVNPKQFAPGEDFAAYPRDLETDRATVEAAGADLVYAPALPTMYPDGFATTVNMRGPAVVGLEDRFRPSHFDGVATIVAKLLVQAQTDVAFFGEKDFQQLRVIERLVADLDIPMAIRSIPTVREPDGLAMSSRNAYLTADERARAPVLNQALMQCASTIGEGGSIEGALDSARRQIEKAGFVVDYVEAREADTLAPLMTSDSPGRVLAAARLGRTRLIDNVSIPHRSLPSG